MPKRPKASGPKHWFMQFEPAVWLKDPRLSMCTPATRGVWMDLLCAMHELDRSGLLRGSTDSIARIARCSTVDLTQALTDLQATGAADVTFRNGDVTVINRRMSRLHKATLSALNRQRKKRGQELVTLPSREKDGDEAPHTTEAHTSIPPTAPQGAAAETEPIEGDASDPVELGVKWFQWASLSPSRREEFRAYVRVLGAKRCIQVMNEAVERCDTKAIPVWRNWSAEKLAGLVAKRFAQKPPATRKGDYDS